MSLWDRLRETLQAVQEYPDLAADLDAVQFELRQAQQALEKNGQELEAMYFASNEQQAYTEFLSSKAEAFQDALREFCPKLSTPEEMKRFYNTVSPSMDESGFTLYRMAKELTGIDVLSCFPYEDNCGMFEEMEGHRLLDWLTAVRFDAVEWEIVTGTCYEKASLQEVDTSTPEYQVFEQKLYRAVLTRMGFEDLLAPEAHTKSQEKEVITSEEKITELKLYSHLFGELTEQECDDPEPLSGRDLIAFQDVILRGIEDERLPDEEEQGLMTCFDGSEAVNEKVVSLFPSVEVVDGELYGVAVCKINGTLSSSELEELKEYCHSQYTDAWGADFAERPRRTNFGELHISFCTDSGASFLTKEELGSAQALTRSRLQARRDGGER